jgi:hypothetical protein
LQFAKNYHGLFGQRSEVVLVHRHFLGWNASLGAVIVAIGHDPMRGNISLNVQAAFSPVDVANRCFANHSSAIASNVFSDPARSAHR